MENNIEKDFGRLTGPDIEVLRDRYELLKKVAVFQDKVDIHMFRYIYGEDLAEHMMIKFREECRGNILVFINRLDAVTQEKTLFVMLDDVQRVKAYNNGL